MSHSPRHAPDAAGASDGPRLSSATVPILICALVAVVYVATLVFGFVYDDNFQIAGNTWLSLRYVSRYFTGHVWSFAGIRGFYWRPLFLVWLLLQRIAFGLNPAGWHAATVALHLVTTMLFYRVARRISGDGFLAGIAAAVFGVHPALIETVAWVSGSSDSLLAVFLLSAFLAFLNWRERQSNAWLVGSIALFAGAMMAKETGAMLLPLVACHAALFSEGTWAGRIRSGIRAALPYLPVAVLYVIVHTMVVDRLDFVSVATPATMAWTAPSLLLFYFRLLVFPYPISPEYPVTLVRQFSFAHVLLPCLVLAAVAGCMILLARRMAARGDRRSADLALFAFCWLALPLVPVLYLKAVRWQDFAHSRYLYLSCMGFALLVAMAIRRIPTTTRRFAGLPATQAAATAMVVAALAVGCVSQEVYWASDLLLFTRGSTVAPNNPVGLTNLGMEYGKRKQYDEAISLFRRAFDSDPNFSQTLFGLGYTYYVLGRYAEAEPLIERALRLHPTDSDADQWAYLGLTALRLNDISKAEWAVRNAIHTRPNVARYHHALALILEREHREAEAKAEFRETLKYDPENADAKQRLAQP